MTLPLSPPVARRAGVALALAAAFLTGCESLTIEIMPRHYHGCEPERLAGPVAEAGAGTGADDALAPEYVAEQAQSLVDRLQPGSTEE